MTDLFAAALPGLKVVELSGPGGWWLRGGDAPLLRVVQVAGRPCLWHAERVAEVAADLDAAQRLLDRVEQASGWRFEPELLEQAQPELVIGIADDEVRIDIGLLADQPVPSALIAAAAAVPIAPDRPRPTTLTLLSDPLAIDEADALAVGDLLLLPDQAPARIAGHEEVAAALDLTQGVLTAAPWLQAASRGFGAVVEITLPPAPVTPASLAALAETPIPLGPTPLNTVVQLALAGQALAEGVLVRLGQRHAIRITKRDKASAA